MSKLKLTIGMLAVITIMCLNFGYANNGYGVTAQTAFAADSDSNGSGSGSGGSDCCSWWGSLWGNCNQRTEETEISEIKCTIKTTTYYDANGNIVGMTVTSNGVIQGEFNGSYAYKEDSVKEYTMKNVTKVNCPTNGNCNNCEEYTPKCE